MRLEYFQMIDRITTLDPDAHTVRAECVVPDDSPVFEGHFPGYPLLPGVLMIETMAQTGGWLVLSVLQFTRMPFLSQVKEAKLRGFVSPGQRLHAEAHLAHDGSGYAVVNARLTLDSKTVAEAELRYRVVAFPNNSLHAAMLEAARRAGVPERFLHGG
ncbi:MAG: beta-hydroxyacyl-ACP dehydratase [Acetobacteraceae bacterium]|nr:beta-hydroxyacyl-ACP dehydratase [Acetobacteraceae bacterium]